jgi:hypothetical protein
MDDTGTPETVLAAELERIAAELRDDEATLHGYRVRERDGDVTESGGVDCSLGWFRFQLRSAYR